MDFFSSSSLPDVTLGCLLDQSIYMPIRGFYVTDFPLWKLGYLLEECWIEEDVINALSKLEYFKTAALSNSNSPPSHLYLLMSFSNTLASFPESHRAFTSELIDLWEQLQITDVVTFGFLVCDAGHYSGYHKEPSKLRIDHGDTLWYPAACDGLDVVNWVFYDILHLKNVFLRLQFLNKLLLTAVQVVAE